MNQPGPLTSKVTWRRRKHCCCPYQMTTFYGRSLDKGVIIVGGISIGLAVLTFVVALIGMIIMLNTPESFAKNPVKASSMILVLVVIPMSVYQFIISVMLVYQAVKQDSEPFICSVWFTSNVTILVIYFVLFLTKSASSIYYKEVGTGILYLFLGIAYELIIIYFLIVVNSYFHTIEKDVYF